LTNDSGGLRALSLFASPDGTHLTGQWELPARGADLRIGDVEMQGHVEQALDLGMIDRGHRAFQQRGAVGQVIGRDRLVAQSGADRRRPGDLVKWDAVAQLIDLGGKRTFYRNGMGVLREGDRS
jgi:hypothetical protein